MEKVSFDFIRLGTAEPQIVKALGKWTAMISSSRAPGSRWRRAEREESGQNLYEGSFPG
jgi:hypothetical protein